MHFPRKAGILLHPTSLPGPYGIGEIGPYARQFVHLLRDAGQSYWQVLPLGPTGYGDSPYQALSTFAANAMLISFDDLLEEGLLKPADLANFPEFPLRRVDYGPVLLARRAVLDRVCRLFSRRASAARKTAFDSFCAEQADWLEDYADFVVLKEQNGLRPWTEWPREFAHRDPAALKRFRTSASSAIRQAKVRQFLVDAQWRRLRDEARAAGIKLIGDIPIFVAHDSADVWAHPEMFYLDENGMPTGVAGVPPDYFSATGQLWGNPLYRWDLHRQSGYAWWMKRMKHMLHQVDIVRIDHFRGFEAYWEIPAGEPNAIRGHWVKGPGADFFEALRQTLGDTPVIAEDLGLITPEVDALRDAFHLPGMRILQFSFADDLKPHMRPEGFPENCVVYTGTHDNDTTVGWFYRRPGENNTETAAQIATERAKVLSWVHTAGIHIHWDLIALAHRLPPHTAIVPLQDILGLGAESRMNVPGRMEGNWSWRFSEGDLHLEDLRCLRDITAWAGRL